MVDVVAPHAEVAGDGDEAIGEARGAADVELALAQVGDELVDEARGERHPAAIADQATGDLTGTRVLVVALVPVAAITALGHLVAILASQRLR